MTPARGVSRATKFGAIRAANVSLATEPILMVDQKDAKVVAPSSAEMYEICTLVRPQPVDKTGHGTIKAIIRAITRSTAVARNQRAPALADGQEPDRTGR